MPATERSKNIVKKNARTKISKKATEKNYVPGVYDQHHPAQCDHILKSRPIHLKLKNVYEGKEICKVVERDNVRDLLVPAEDINVYPAVWNNNQMSRLQNQAKIVTKEDRQAQLERIENEKKKMIDESEKRRMLLREIDRKKNEKLQSEKENDSNKDTEDAKVLDKFTLIKQENEEEVRKANRVILTTKCQIIRDAQIAEKMEIKREFRDEELRLEKMINENVEKKLEHEEFQRQQKRKLNEIHANELKNQLHQREMAKIIEAERIEEEAKAMSRAQIAITLDMMEKEKQRREKMAKVKFELQKANELSEFFKRLQFEEQRIADLKVQEYMRQKAIRDAEIAKEKRLLLEQKERERERLLLLQTKLLETKSAQNEQGMRREQEEKEREFRRKEKEAVLKKKKVEEEIENARKVQLEIMKKQRALQIARDEFEHKRVCEQLQLALEKDKQKEENKQMSNKKYRSEIIKQMNEREIHRREMLRRAKNEYNAQIEQERNRLSTVNNVISMKIKDMRNNRVPEKFVKDVERQLQTITNATLP